MKKVSIIITLMLCLFSCTSKNKKIVIEGDIDGLKNEMILVYGADRNGDALDTIKAIKNLGIKFDFIFIDADKEEYPFYFDICLPMLKKNGIIAADNIIFPKRFKKHIKKYLNHIRGVKSVKSITFPIGNGQELSFKI